MVMLEVSSKRKRGLHLDGVRFPLVQSEKKKETRDRMRGLRTLGLGFGGGGRKKIFRLELHCHTKRRGLDSW